jgi:uncharacterized membrane protein
MPFPLLATAEHANAVIITDPAGVLAALLAVLATIFWLTQHKTFGRLFKIIPALVFCYFVPTTLTTLHIIPDESPLYDWIKAYMLPASLMLLILSLDVPAILRLGPKAVIMLLVGTVGVVIGGPIALLVCKGILPDDAWRGMTALAGSWIGGGANFVALGQIAKTSDSMMGLMVVPDVLVANVWTGILLYWSGKQREIDRWTGANADAIRRLEDQLTTFQQQVTRVPTLADLIILVAIGFVTSVAAHELSKPMAVWFSAIGATTWKYILVTTAGVILSFTRARRLEGVGASKVGGVMLYLLIACIGAGADFRKIAEAPEFVLMGAIWLAVHITLIMVVGYLIRAPIFFIAVGSQANIGGAASAPVVAAAFHPSLAPVGVLLAVAGYVLGTYAGLVCMRLLMVVAQVDGV